MPPPGVALKKDERPNRKRSPSVIHKVWNFARNASGSKTPPPSSPSSSRSASLQPSSPLLQPTTSAVTAPGSILKASHASPTLSAQDVHSFETAAAWLASQVHTLAPEQVIAQLNKLEKILHAPGQSQPEFSAIQPLLSVVCSWDVEYTVRQAGFNLLSVFLETPPHDVFDYDDVLDHAMVWHFIRTVPQQTYALEEDWEQRLRALHVLTASGRDIDGLDELVPTLCTWQVKALEASSSVRVFDNGSSSDAYNERIGLQKRASDIQRFLINICYQNISTLSERDEECVIVAFLKALEFAVRDEARFTTRGDTSDGTRPSPTLIALQRSPSRVPGIQIPSLGRSASRHKRNSSSQSITPHAPRPHSMILLPQEEFAAPPVVEPTPTPWLFQAAAFVRLFSILSAKAPLPSNYVQPAIQSLLFILGSTATSLPPVCSTEEKDRQERAASGEQENFDRSPALLEHDAWSLISILLSSGYGTTTAHEIKQNMLAPEMHKSPDGLSSNEMRKSRGAARALRLALRQGTQHRLALSRNEDPDDISTYPTIMSSSNPGLGRYGPTSDVGPSLAATQAQEIVGRAVRVWLASIADRSDADAESVILECVGLAKDIVDECAAVDRLVSDDEAHIVGETLRQAVACLRTPTKPGTSQGSRPSLAEAVSSLLYSVPLSMPITPNPCDIILSVAEHIPDAKGVVVIDHIFREVLSFPSASNWLPTLQDVFAKLHGPVMSLSRRAMAQHVRSLYDDVRDLANFRDPLVRTSVEAWEKSLLYEDNEGTVKDIMAILSDAIVAGAAEEQFRDHASPTSPRPQQSWGGAGLLDQRIVDLLVRVASGCDCPEDVQSSTGSDRGTIHRGISSDIVAERPMRSTPPPSVPPSRDVSMSPITPYPTYAPVFGAPGDDETTLADTKATGTPTPQNETFVSHDRSCKSMSAVLALILTFNRLAFSPPHSLDPDSPFKAARAPASSKCINVWENILSLLGPTYTTTSLPEGESRKPGHKQASCRRARLAILQWILRLRADRDHRLYFKDDLSAEVEAFAQLIARDAHSSSQTTPDLSTESPDVGARLGRTGRSVVRREPDNRGRSRRSSDSRSQSRFSRPDMSMAPPNNDVPREPIWSLPDILPFDVPSDASRPSEGMTTYSDPKAREKEPNDVMPDLWLSISTYVCIMTDIMEDETDWEIFSYALCHLPLQLSNKHLFCGPRTRESICNMVSLMTNSILSDKFGSRTRIPHNLKNTDVWGLACQTLTIFVGYRDSFRHRERPLGEALVSAFCHGLNRHTSVAKPSLQALAICAYEFETATAKYLPQVLDHLVQVISKPDISRQILELLAILGKMPAMYSNLRHSHFEQIFSTAGRYIQRHNKPSHMSVPSSSAGTKAKIEGESFALSQHVLVLAYYSIYIWYLGIEQPMRRAYIPTISRFLWIANHGQTGMDEMTEVCFDWLKRYTAGDVSARPTQDTVLCKPNPRSKSWLLGNALMTIESLQSPGWLGITVRGASGTVHLTVRVDNMTTQRFEEIDPLTLVPRSVIDDAQDPDPPRPQRAISLPNVNDNLDPGFLPLQMSRYPSVGVSRETTAELLINNEDLERAVRVLDGTPVVELHKVGVMYVAPGQTIETEILGNRTGSPAYASFLASLGHIIKLKDQRTVYPGGLDTSSDFDGEFAYVWWDEIAQIVFHATTMMPNIPQDTSRMYKKRHVGNDWVRIVWNDSGGPYRFDTLSTEFQLVNIIIEPHSSGITAAYSNSPHENEFFKLTLQRAEGVPEFGPLGEFKLLSLRNLPSYVRQISLLASLFAQVYDFTKRDTRHEEYVTSWRRRLGFIKGLRKTPERPSQETQATKDRPEFGGDFTPYY